MSHSPNFFVSIIFGYLKIDKKPNILEIIFDIKQTSAHCVGYNNGPYLLVNNIIIF